MPVLQLKAFPTDPVPPAPGNPRCDHKVHMIGDHVTNWRKSRYGDVDTDRCTRDAVVQIGDKRYCRLHGGHVVLDMFLDGRLVEK